METRSGKIIEDEEASVAEKPQDALIILQTMIENDRQHREEERKPREEERKQREQDAPNGIFPGCLMWPHLFP